MADPDILRTSIDDLHARLASFPSIDSSAGDIMDQHRCHRLASDQLADYLRAAYSAQILEEAWTNTIRMHGIRSSSTSGLCNAFRNWIAAAEKRLAASDD